MRETKSAPLDKHKAGLLKVRRILAGMKEASSAGCSYRAEEVQLVATEMLETIDELLRTKKAA